MNPTVIESESHWIQDASLKDLLKYIVVFSDELQDVLQGCILNPIVIESELHGIQHAPLKVLLKSIVVFSNGIQDVLQRCILNPIVIESEPHWIEDAPLKDFFFRTAELHFITCSKFWAPLRCIPSPFQNLGYK